MVFIPDLSFVNNNNIKRNMPARIRKGNCPAKGGNDRLSNIQTNVPPATTNSKPAFCFINSFMSSGNIADFQFCNL